MRLRLWSLTSEHLPRPLFDKYASRLPELPWEYTKHMISASLGSRLVYREGLQARRHTRAPPLHLSPAAQCERDGLLTPRARLCRTSVFTLPAAHSSSRA